MKSLKTFSFTFEAQESSFDSSNILKTFEKQVTIPDAREILDVQVSPPLNSNQIITNFDSTNKIVSIKLENVRHTSKDQNNYYLGTVEDRSNERLCWYQMVGFPSREPWPLVQYVDLNQTCPANLSTYTSFYNYTVIITYVDDSPLSLIIDTKDSELLTEGSLYKISGTVNGHNIGKNTTIKYRVNNNQERVLTTFSSESTSSLDFSKFLTCGKGALYDGTVNVSGDLAEGVFHTLHVWAEDISRGSSEIVTRRFKVVVPKYNEPTTSVYIGSIPCSSDFIRAMRSPMKQTYIKLEFYDASMNFIGEFTRNVCADDIGSISVDLNRPVRRTFSFSLDNHNDMFNWGEDKLVWINKRVKLSIGLKLINGQIEYVPQGVFIVSEPQDSHTLEGKRTYITGQDKMWLMTDKRGKFLYQTTIEEGTNIGTALKIIASKAGETLFNFDDIEETVPYELTYSPDDNLYKALEELALLAKGIIYYDVFGYLTFKKIDLNSFESAPITWTYRYDDPLEYFYAGNVRQMDEELLANHIVVLGGSSQTAIASYEIVVDENDPLWKGNPYSVQEIGRITYFHNNGNPDSLLLTDEECKWRAKYELMKRLGYTERVSLNIAPVYLHDVGDVIQIEDSNNGVSGKYLLERFSVPINPAIMQCECIKYHKVIDDWNFI